jgi:hypothetical protein
VRSRWFKERVPCNCGHGRSSCATPPPHQLGHDMVVTVVVIGQLYSVEAIVDTSIVADGSTESRALKEIMRH